MTPETLHERLNTVYDERMYSPLVNEFYAGSDFHNFGYWTGSTRTAREAGENLMERLLAFLPRRTGTILDVACGKGASTRHLLRYYPPGSVIGVNISLKQLKTASENAPGARFVLMDAPRLAFADRSIDNILCVEAALHFKTREQFLTDALRVLRPGGRLVVCDLLVRPVVARSFWRMPPENHLDDPAAYRALCERVGFRGVEVVDATRECTHGYHRALFRFARDKARDGVIDVRQRRQIGAYVLAATFACKHYVLVAGTKA
jgi:SAM-dependent methyltransferase